MSDVTLGKISSHPNENGEHVLKCPQCSHSFQTTISKDDKTGAIEKTTCPVCVYQNEPKYFVAAAHQSEVNSLTMGYAAKELKNLRININ